MKWFKNNLIDEKNKYLVGYDQGGDCCDWAEVIVYDSKENDITESDLSEWEFTAFPNLSDCYESRDDGYESDDNFYKSIIPTLNSVTGEAGCVVLTCHNNGYYSADFWAREIGEDDVN